MKPISSFLTALSCAAAFLAAAPAQAGPEISGRPDSAARAERASSAARRGGERYQIVPDAVYAVPKPSATVSTYGTRRYAGREYLIVPGQWYPPVWEDPCTVKRTCAIPGVAPWPGVRVDVNSDEIDLVPVGPAPVPVRCAPAVQGR